MTSSALLCLSALLLFLPFLLLPRRPRGRFQPEIRGTLVPMHWMVVVYCALAPLEDQRVGPVACQRTGDPDRQPHLRDRPPGVAGWLPARPGLHDCPGVLRLALDSLVLQARWLHPGEPRRPRHLRHAGCAAGPEGGAGLADLPGGPDHAELRAGARPHATRRSLPGDPLGRARDPGIHPGHAGDEPDWTLVCDSLAPRCSSATPST